jgi:uncharacterized membrane protein
VSPFDLKSVFFAKHAQHVVLIHFPIALFTAAVAFDYLGQWTKNKRLATAAYLNIVVAAASTLPVIVTGVMAWRWALEGQKLKGILLSHLIFGGLTSLFIWMVFLIHVRAQRHPDALLPNYRLPIEAIGVLLVGLTGHLGGVLSGVTGAG